MLFSKKWMQSFSFYAKISIDNDNLYHLKATYHNIKGGYTACIVSKK
ncbi:hypothetical protein QE450_003190 [Paenibacillus sp. SORGH_AS306]|nr:hypothetical protein [Paenibacillus sp. SORGH_AS_0306]MDR6112741.1 hypothetical protein [Paenibacillus sp. SORGH_AS_0338]